MPRIHLPTLALSRALTLSGALALSAFFSLPSAAWADSKEDANKKTVVEFYTKLFVDKDFEAARPFFGDRYIQHNPHAADGPEALRQFLTGFREKFPNAKSEIKRVFADGDFVILHVHARREPTDKGVAIVDIFRLENGKVVEHWDVVQPIPDTAANSNTMF